jgi:hypothetical protein
MERLAPQPPRRRRAHPRHGVLLTAATVALVAALGLAGCSGGGDSASSAATTSLPRSTRIELPLGDVSADSAGAPVNVSPEQSQAVLDVLDTYLKDATVQPLRSGKPASADLGAVFDATTLTPATTTDRGVVFDEGLPRVSGKLDVEGQPVNLVGLGDQGGNLSLVTAAMLVDVKGQTAGQGDPLHIVRRADFVLAPVTGAWKVTSYRVVVTREGGGLDAPTTTGVATGLAK